MSHLQASGAESAFPGELASCCETDVGYGREEGGFHHTRETRPGCLRETLNADDRPTFQFFTHRKCGGVP